MAVLTVDSAQFSRIQRLLVAIKGGAEIAGSKAINDTLRFIRASAVRKIKAKLNIKAKDIRSRFFLVRANRAKQQGKMIVTGEFRLPLFLFGAKQRKKGVSYKLRPGEKRKLIPGAFIHEGKPYVFVREFADTEAAESGSRAFAGEQFAGRKRVGRSPIRPVFGPSIGRIFREEAQQVVEREASDKLAERLDFHVDALLLKQGL